MEKIRFKDKAKVMGLLALMTVTGCAPVYQRNPRLLKTSQDQKVVKGSSPIGDAFILLFSAFGAKPSQSPTNFDWQAYQRNFYNSQIEVNNPDFNPAFYCFGGWDLGKNNQIFRMTDNIALSIEHSDYQVFNFESWRDSLEKIKHQYFKQSPIILIGHSGGGSNAIKVTKILEKVNVPVGLMLIDSTHLKSEEYFPPVVEGLSNNFTIPSNVFHVENYVTGGPYEGRNLKEFDFANSRTTFRNHHISGHHLTPLEKRFAPRYVKSIKQILNKR